jgi:hypothetical protein
VSNEPCLLTAGYLTSQDGRFASFRSMRTVRAGSTIWERIAK